MKKPYYLVGLAALAMVGCSDNDLLGGGNAGPNGSQEGNGAVQFFIKDSKVTRDGEITGQEAAAKLNYQFIVWGEKNAEKSGSATHPNPESVDYEGNLVFQNYKVVYTKGSGGTTESNSSDWEYVGYTPYNDDQVSPALTAEQTIKYWDYSADDYVYNAFSVSGNDIKDGKISVKKAVVAESSSATKYDKGYELTINEGADLDSIYFADRTPVTERNNTPTNPPTYGTDYKANKFGDVVKLTFRAAASKIRFAVYETVPGYKIEITKMYFTDNNSEAETSTTTNFAIDGGFTKIGGTPATMKVGYYPDGVTNAAGVDLTNQPKVSVTGGDALSSMIFGDKNVGGEEIGTQSNQATYDLENGAYTTILPNTSNDKPMNLKVDYKLTSTDGSKEVINVKHATAVVPAGFCQWQPNFAYTYIFKISDNTNGTTGDPGTTDPKGLYPITFDAVVADAVIGEQQTITTIADPSITTYANGVIVTDDNEYKVGNDIYVAVMKGKSASDEAADLSGKAKVYRAFALGAQPITERALQNAGAYGIILEPISSLIDEKQAFVTEIPMADGSTKAIKALKFTAKVPVTYVFEYNNGGAKAYKVIKVVGSGTYTNLYAWGPDKTISATSDVMPITLKDNGLEVVGAEKYIGVVPTDPSNSAATDLKVVESSENGKYNVSLTDEALQNGNCGTYSLYLQKKNTSGVTENVSPAATITVVDNYTWNSKARTAIEGLKISGGDSKDVALAYNGTAIPKAATTSARPNDVKVTDTDNDGTYTISVEPGTKNADNNDAITTNVTIAGETVTVTVYPYVVNTVNETLADAASIASYPKNFTITTGNDDAPALDASKINITAPNGSKVTGTVSGTTVNFTATMGGTYQIEYKGYTGSVTIDKYVATVSPATISAKNGASTLTINKNGAIDPAVELANVTIVKTGTSTDVTSQFDKVLSGKQVKITRKTALAGTYTVKYTVNGIVVATTTLNVTSAPASTTEEVTNGAVTW